MAKLTAKKAVVNQQLGIRILVELQNKEMNRLDMKGDFTVEKGNSLVPGFDVGQFVFPSPGIYHVKLYVNNKPLITRSLRVRSVGELTEK